MLMDIWPESLVEFVRGIKEMFGAVKASAFWGIPLDLPFRFLLAFGLYLAFASRWSRRRAFLCVFGILVAKEFFDMFAVRVIDRIHWPDLGDYLDILSGLVGIACGEGFMRIRTRRKKEKEPTG
jgi:hypothetical protein